LDVTFELMQDSIRMGRQRLASESMTESRHVVDGLESVALYLEESILLREQLRRSLERLRCRDAWVWWGEGVETPGVGWVEAGH